MSKPKSRVMYMHTIDGRPAIYLPKRETLVSTIRHGRAVPLAASRKQIKHEQRRDAITTAVNGWEGVEYGYVRVEIPADV